MKRSLQRGLAVALGLGMLGGGLGACVPHSLPAAPADEPAAVSQVRGRDLAPVGPSAVWRPDPIPCRSGGGDLSDAALAPCLQQAMRTQGASVDAQAFAASLSWQGFLSYRGAEGKVVSGVVTHVPQGSRTNEVPVLLNGDPSPVYAWELWEKHMGPVLKKKYPKGFSDFEPPFLVKAEATASGGQRFIYEGEVRDCRACVAMARPRMRVVFDKTGRFTGVER